MDWKMKLKDELISRTVIMAVAFTVPLFFVQLSATNAQVYMVLAGMAVGGGYVKSVQNMVKSKYSQPEKGD